MPSAFMELKKKIRKNNPDLTPKQIEERAKKIGGHLRGKPAPPVKSRPKKTKRPVRR